MKIRVVLLATVLGLAQSAWAEDAAPQNDEPAGAVDASSNVPMAQETAEPAVEESMAEEAPMAEEAMEPAAGMAMATGTVSRAQFTSAIENREPVDTLDAVENDLRTVYFFTELRDMDGQTVVHRWTYNGQVMAEVSFPVGGSRWRVYSSKNLIPEWVGTWAVEVLNANGEVIESKSFTYVNAAAVEDAMEAPEAADEMSAEEPADAPAAEQMQDGM